MQERIRLVAPLIDQLRRFCDAHLDGDPRAAASEMLVFVRDAWSHVPEAVLGGGDEDRRDAEGLALGIVRDVGELAGMLADTDDPDRALAWSRANLIRDLERYLEATCTA